MGCRKLDISPLEKTPLQLVYSAGSWPEKTGVSYSYFGARYYDPNISIWLSVDPLSDKYPNQTPFSYVGNRPVMVLDPYGRDEWEINGVTGKISRVNENKHYLDQNGSRIIVKAGEVYQGNADLSTLTEVDLLSNEKERSIDVSAGILGRQQTNEEEYQSFSFGSHAEAIDLYYFWAKSSNAEIAMCLTNTGGGHVGTDYSSENTRMTQLYESFFTSSISLMSHSHSGSGGPPTYNVWTQNGKGGDLNNAFKSKYDYTREVYDVPNSLIYQYSRGTMIKADETRGAVTWDGKPRKAR